MSVGFGIKNSVIKRLLEMFLSFRRPNIWDSTKQCQCVYVSRQCPSYELGTLILPTEKLIGTYDLWTGKAVKSGAEKDEKGRRFLLEIPIRGSMLLFACSKEEYEFLPECVLDILEINPQFILVQEDEDKVQKT